MFKNLKAKVKQEASLDTSASVNSPNKAKTSTVSDNDTTSNSSKVALDEPVADQVRKRFSISSDEIGKTNLSSTVVEHTNGVGNSDGNELSPNEIELIKEKNQIIVEKLKFQGHNETLLNKIEILNVSVVYFFL